MFILKSMIEALVSGVKNMHYLPDPRHLYSFQTINRGSASTGSA